MTEQKKELKDLLIKEYSCMGCDMITRQEQDSLIDDWAETLGEALIQRYPQITKKPVKFVNYGSLNLWLDEETGYEGELNFSNFNEMKEWIDQHYVEVVS